MAALERCQVLVYAAALAFGVALGHGAPVLGASGEALLWPLLGALLYATFTQVRLAGLTEAFADVRFLAAALAGNFLVVPLLVWGLLVLLPASPALRLGVALVLLVPCTDWFLAFVQQAGGATRRAIALAPVSLLLQLVLLPAYLALYFGGETVVALGGGEVLRAFAGLILLPLGLAWLTQRAGPAAPRLVAGLAWLPVPLLAAVIFLVSASQVDLVREAAGALPRLLPVFVLYLVAAACLAWLLAGWLRLPAAQGRVLAFSFGTRNSFVVLPLALSLPTAYQVAAVVVVFQSLVELAGMIAYLWLVPRWLFPDDGGAGT
ncbi:bile acid:sodium symporter [Aquisalimonas lutea]|uniref:arsenic resistance protein n=1 Tax=Aquisalimonas lutea TaxID=1327750 RepID=UPI0025B46E54|nr:bile acid:sodium symporter [Aquisalimonas lutea]MDN3516453.1 bile acid:sodium symporter [Aquisalimonas lutea]